MIEKKISLDKLFFFYFFLIFEEKKSRPAKKLQQTSRISTDQTVQKYWLFRIFHTPWIYKGVWKIQKSQYFCTVWSVEILDRKIGET